MDIWSKWGTGIVLKIATLHEIGPGLHSVICMRISIGITKCLPCPSCELHHHFWRQVWIMMS